MGCCLATQNQKSSSSSFAHSQKLPCRLASSTNGPPKPPTVEDRAPPPSAEELETVKEVLSETPNPKPPPLVPFPQPPHTKFHQQQQLAEIHEEKQSIIHVVMDKMEIEKQLSPLPSEIDGPPEESEEASDFRSLSFSESVSTTALTEKREDDGDEVAQRVFRSPATRKPDPIPKRDRVAPNRRHDRSPGKRVIRRPEQGESSGRRSRSPGMNRSVVNRSPSGRRTGKSPGRARVEPVDGSSKLTRKSNIEDNDSVTDGGQSESLENPLVSLECFIFL